MQVFEPILGLRSQSSLIRFRKTFKGFYQISQLLVYYTKYLQNDRFLLISIPFPFNYVPILLSLTKDCFILQDCFKFLHSASLEIMGEFLNGPPLQICYFLEILAKELILPSFQPTHICIMFRSLHVHNNSRTGHYQFIQAFFKWLVIAGGLLLCGVILVGCTQQGRYMETHEISNLKVVFLDAQSLAEKWESKTGQPGTQFQPWLQGGLASVKTVRGFYDFLTDTLYCPKWNYEVCGHELHHAALGHFHPKE